MHTVHVRNARVHARAHVKGSTFNGTVVALPQKSPSFVSNPLEFSLGLRTAVPRAHKLMETGLAVAPA